MALFGITLKKLEAIPGNLVHDVFGGGSSNNNNKPAPASTPNFYQSPASQAAAAVKPPAVAQPPVFNPALNPPPQQQKKEDLTHNAATDFLGKYIVKPVVAPVIQFGKEAAAVPQAIGREIQNKPINDIQQRVFGTTDPGKIASHIAGSTVGTALTALTPELRGAAAAFKGAEPVAEDALAGDAAKTAASTAESEAPKVADKVAEAKSVTPSTPAPKGLAVSKDAPPATAQAAQDLSDLYDHGGLQADNSHNLINKAIGVTRQFSEKGNNLQKAMESELTDGERVAVRDDLEGVASAQSLNPKVRAVTNLMRQLNDKGYDALDAANKTPVHRVQQYATRLLNSTDKPGASPLEQGFNNIKSLFNVHSGFANNRAVGKFVSSRGDAIYGTKTDLGLTTDKAGNLVDENGLHYKPTSVSTSELNANSPYNYEGNYGRVSNVYHSSVGRVKVGKAAADELASNPEKYGLTTEPIKGYEPIREVPQLEGYFAPRKAAAEIDGHLGQPRGSGAIEKGFQGLSRGIIQSIVYNPLFHGRNLNELAGLAAGKVRGFAGPLELKAKYMKLADMTPEERAALGDDALQDGVIKQTYGADRDTVLTKAADAAGLPHISKASPVAMGHIDWNIRLALYSLAKDEGKLPGEQAAALVNHFLGEAEGSGPVARNVGLFWHYMKTRVNIVTDALRHPNENAGTFIAAGEQAALLYGTTKAFQEWTGNKHASLGHPGLFGLANEVKTVAGGRPNAAATTSLNPLVTAGLNQLYGKDLYTGQDITGNRLKNAEQTLFAPAQNVSKVQAGKATPGQEAIQMLTGVSTPHTAGAPAIPNKNNPLAVINEKGAKPAEDAGKIHDPTGLDQASLYFKAKDKALKSVGNDPLATDTVNAYLDDNVNAKGDKVKKGPEQSLGVANLLAETPDALKAMQAFQKSQPKHDPMWDLSPADLKTFLQYEGSRQETGEREAAKILDTKFNGGEGLDKFVQDRSAYYTNNKFPQGKALDNPDTPTYPVFKGQQQVDYTTYQNQFKDADGKTKAQFIQAHPDVADALLQVSKYYNAQNVAQGGLAVKGNVELTPAQQQWYDWYSGLPKGTGARSAAIKNNAAMWGSISNALAQSDLVSLAKEGAIDQYAGVPFSQKFLKDAYNAGQYDVSANVPLPGGGTGFAIKTDGSGSGGSGGSSKSSAKLASFIAKSKIASQARDAEHAAKAANRVVRGAQRAAKLHGPKRLSIHMKGEERVRPFKVKGATLSPRQVNKVALKPQKALQRSNHAKLRA